VTVTEAERLARVSLNVLYEPGDPRVTSLAHELGAERLLEELLSSPEATGPDSAIAGRLRSLDAPRVLGQARSRGFRYVIPGDDEWPASLDGLAGAGQLHGCGGIPLGLWVRGPLRLDSLAGAVAMVGSRDASSYGAEAAGDIAAIVARDDRVVVSGGAIGIDSAAHRGALGAHGRTIAVLACGVDKLYPRGEAPLLAHLAEHHALVSETPPGGAPLKQRFLSRNRIIAALGVGTVVVEAAHRSGSLTTANWAERLVRPVMGLPGPITSAVSAGVHQLIRNGGATVVTHGAEVLELVGSAGDHLLDVPRTEPRPRDRLTSRERLVLDAVPVSRPAPVDSIARTAGVALRECRASLGILVRRGFVTQLPGGWQLAEDALDAARFTGRGA